MENMAAAPPVYILNARCEVYADYVKRKHTFRLNSTDGAEYLFAAENGTKMIEWVEKINFHARLAPSNQLASFQTIGPGCDATVRERAKQGNIYWRCKTSFIIQAKITVHIFIVYALPAPINGSLFNNFFDNFNSVNAKLQN